MLLGFKKQFAGFVREGSKTHTVRGLRKHPPRIGEICHCFYALRTKQCELLGRWPCMKVEEAVISLPRVRALVLSIELGGVSLTTDEAEAFARADGFRTLTNPLHAMCAFWVSNNGLVRGKPFVGQVIHWNFKEAYVGHKTKGKAVRGAARPSAGREAR